MSKKTNTSTNTVIRANVGATVSTASGAIGVVTERDRKGVNIVIADGSELFSAHGDYSIQDAPAIVAEAAPIVEPLAEAAPAAPAIVTAPAAPKPTKTRDCVLALIRASITASETDIPTLKNLASRLTHRADKESEKSAESKEGKLIRLIKLSLNANTFTIEAIREAGTDCSHRLGSDYYVESRYSHTYEKTVEAFTPRAAPAIAEAETVG